MRLLITGHCFGSVLFSFSIHRLPDQLRQSFSAVPNECPADGVHWAFTVAGSYGGRVVEPQHPVPISIPMALDGFRIVGMDGAEISFTLSEGLLTMEAQEAGLFLLLPVM